MVRAYKGKTSKVEYKVKRVVIYKDGTHKIMIGTRSQFKKLWQSDKSIDRVWRISWFKRKYPAPDPENQKE